MENKEQALRYDAGKLDWTLLDFHSIEPLVRVMAYGEKKYSRDNWKGKLDDPMQHIRCAFRHLIAIASGQEIDPESGQPHSGHVMANMMMFNYHCRHATDDLEESVKSVDYYMKHHVSNVGDDKKYVCGVDPCNNDSKSDGGMFVVLSDTEHKT